MSKPLLLGTCLAVALTGCVINTPHDHKEKVVNTALTGACLAAQLGSVHHPTLGSRQNEGYRGQGNRRPGHRATRFNRRQPGGRTPLVLPDRYRPTVAGDLGSVRDLWGDGRNTLEYAARALPPQILHLSSPSPRTHRPQSTAEAS